MTGGRLVHEPRLGERRAIGVVVDVDRGAEPRAELVPERYAGERDVHARHDRSRGELDLRGQPDAHRLDRAGRVHHLAHGRLDALEHGLRTGDVGRPLGQIVRRRARHPRGGDLGAPHIDADDGRLSGVLHDRRLSPTRACPESYPPGARSGRTASVDRRLASKNIRTGLIAGAICFLVFGAAFFVAAVY